MRRNIYAIGFVRKKKVYYLKTRETNFRRACKTLRTLLKKNTTYKEGIVGQVTGLDADGNEKDVVELYRTHVK